MSSNLQPQSIDNPRDILSNCSLKKYDDPCVFENELIQKFGNPNKSIYMDEAKVTLQNIVYDNPLVLPLYNAKLELIQCAVLQVDKHVSIIPEGVAKGFAYYGGMQKDKPVLVTHSLEAFFKLAQTSYSVVLVVLPHLCNRQTKQLNTSDFKKILSIVKQLEKTGFSHLYMLVRPENIHLDAFVELAENTSLCLLNQYMKVENSEFFIELSKDECPNEISAFLNESINKNVKKIILPHGHVAKPFLLDSGEKLYILERGLVLIQNKQNSEDETKQESVFISPLVTIHGEARSLYNDNWQRVIQFRDKDGQLHTLLLPYESFMGEAQDALRMVANHGLMPPRKAFKKNLFIQYLQEYPINKRFRCVERMGWHSECYVTPHRTYGKNQTEELLFPYEGKNPYTTKGTFDEWQLLSRLIEPHDLAVLAFSCAFSGQLLSLLGVESGGFHIYGSSTDGKSTITKAACSIWGEPNNISRSWRTTDNALENEAELRNDNFLNMDELRQAVPKAVSDIIYMLTGGQGKARSTKNGKNRDSKSFNVMYTSTGEVTLEEHLRRGNIELDAGLLLRFAHLPSNAGKGYGVFNEINYGLTAQDMSNQINLLASQHYGHAGIKWLEYLTQNKPQILKKAQKIFDDFIVKHTDIKNGQIQRVLRRFALVAVAGELATEAGITGWHEGRGCEAMQCCFKKWSDSLKDVGSLEERKILESVKTFFEAHGTSRFENLSALPFVEGEELRQRVHNRVGYYDSENGMYLVSSEMFKKEICIGINEASAKEILIQKGWLQTSNEGKKILSSKKVSKALPDGTRPRMMHFSVQAMQSDDLFYT